MSLSLDLTKAIGGLGSVIENLKRLSGQKTINETDAGFDNKPEEVVDAYDRGCEDGRVELAREILRALDIERNV